MYADPTPSELEPERARDREITTGTPSERATVQRRVRMCQCPRPSQPWSSMAQIERYLETAPPSLLHKCPGSSNERVVRCVGIKRSESVDVYVSATKPRRGSHSTTNLSTRASECRTHVESESSSYVGRSSKSSREKRGRRERVKRMTKNDAPLAKRCNEERGSSAMRPMCVAA